MNQDKVGNFIKKCRTEKKMTQADLAEKLGVSSKAISKWECGKGLPDVSLFESICEELDISLNELFAGEKIADKDIASKSEKTILKLAQENQNQKFSIKRVFKVTVIIIILFCYIFCKTLAYMSYVIIKKDLNEQYHVAKLAKIFNERESFIIHAKDNDEDAITFNGLSIRDDYQDYKIISNSNNYLTYAILSIESNRIIKEFSIFYNADNGNRYKYWNNVFENEKKRNILERLFDSGVDLSKDFKKFEVNNDIGLYNYFFEKYNNDSNNIMSPIFNIKNKVLYIIWVILY